jgi:hypothetical protein
VVAAIRCFDPQLICSRRRCRSWRWPGQQRVCGWRRDFADRTYTDAGNLVPRSQPGAQLHNGRRMRRARAAHARRGRHRQRRRASASERISQHLRARRWTAGGGRGDRHPCALLAAGISLLPLPQVLAPAESDVPPSTMV